MIFAWAIVTTLYRPAITPDQPWASRRLVPTVLPGFILLAVWAADWLLDLVRAQGRRPGGPGEPRRLRACTLVLPAAIDHVRPAGQAAARSGSGSPRGPGVQAHLRRRDPGGERGMCAAIPRDASVVFIDSGGGGQATRLD